MIYLFKQLIVIYEENLFDFSGQELDVLGFGQLQIYYMLSLVMYEWLVDGFIFCMCDYKVKIILRSLWYIVNILLKIC